MVEERVQRRLAAILAADVVGYSRLMGVDEVGTRARFNAHLKELLKPLIADHQGRIVQVMGDGLLVEYGSVVDAVQCAVAIQEGMASRNAEMPEDRRIDFRIGVNLGDVIIEGEDIHGDGVNVAARIEGLCGPGEVYVSGIVHGQVEGKLELAFEDKGEQSVKNIAKPVRVYRVRTSSKENIDRDATGDALALPDKPSIAVLAFENMSGDPEQEYFADGIAEDIITVLTKISGLFVIARHSSFVYKEKLVSVKQVGQELGVRYVLEGSVRKAGNRLRITAQLIDSGTDHHLWAEHYDRDLEDIFAVQDEVARKVAEALEVALTRGESTRLAQAPTENLEAYDIYLRARRTPWSLTRQHIRSTRIAYERVVEMDPTFAGGHAGKSMMHSMAVLFGYSDDPEGDTRTALELARRAVELDRNFARSHSALGHAHSASGQHEEAIAASRRAVELQPGDADSHCDYARCLLWAGLADEACDEIQFALRLDPQYVEGPYLNIFGRAAFVAGRYVESVNAYERNSARGGPSYYLQMVYWAAACSLAGDLDKARQLITEMRRERPELSLEEVAKFRRVGGASDEEVEHVLKGLRMAWPSE